MRAVFPALLPKPLAGGRSGLRHMPDCLIGLGSNVGDRQESIKSAISALGNDPRISVGAESRCFETNPIGGPPDQPAFLNAAVRLTTSLPPVGLFEVLQAIEQKIGRQKNVRWGPRLLDLDLLLYGDQVIAEHTNAGNPNSAQLFVPHRRMSFRRFVLEPAAEIASSMRHPTIGLTIAELLDHLNATRPYVALTAPPSVDIASLAREISRRTGCHFVAAAKEQWQKSGQNIEFESSNLGFEQQVAMLENHTAALLPEKMPEGSVISDCWFDTLRVNAQRSLGEPQLVEYELLWADRRRRVATPRLIVIIGTAAHAEFNAAIVKQAVGQGPQLLLHETSFEEQCNEVEAALLASQ